MRMAKSNFRNVLFITTVVVTGLLLFEWIPPIMGGLGTTYWRGFPAPIISRVEWRFPNEHATDVVPPRFCSITQGSDNLPVGKCIEFNVIMGVFGAVCNYIFWGILVFLILFTISKVTKLIRNRSA